MEIFQNYLPTVSQSIYQLLLEHSIINGLKFPGNSASPESNKAFIRMATQLGCPIDNHGWNGITGQLHDPHFADHIADLSDLEAYLNLPDAWKYSGHIGVSPNRLPGDKVPQEQYDEIFSSNLEKIRKIFSKLTGKKPTIFGEGVYAPYVRDETTLPGFINRTLSSHGFKEGLDGLVLDISHSSIASAYLSYKYFIQTYSFSDYLRGLDLSAVSTIHIAGGKWDFSPEELPYINFEDNSIMDPHIGSSISNFTDLNRILKKCPNVTKVCNEIAYDHDCVIASPFAYCKEAILTYLSVNTHDLWILPQAWQLIEKDLRPDCTNIVKVINDCKSLI